MFALIASLLQGLVSGVITPLFGYMNKKQDVTLAGFQAASTTDQANYMAYADYSLKLQQVKITANQWWGPKLLIMIIGIPTAIHFAAILLDSTFLFHWHIAKLPSPYDNYEMWVIASLFVTANVSAPVNAVSAWLHRK